MPTVTESDFGAPGSIVLDSTAVGAGTPFDIALDAGANYSAPLRRVHDGSGSYFSYRILQFPLGPEWGDNGITYAAGTVGGNTSGGIDTFQVFGELDTDPAMPNGVLYTDTVTVTVTY